MAPIITDETRVAWEAFAVANQGWLTEARLYQAEKSLGQDVATMNINPEISRLDYTEGFYDDPGVRIHVVW